MTVRLMREKNKQMTLSPDGIVGNTMRIGLPGLGISRRQEFAEQGQLKKLQNEFKDLKIQEPSKER